MLLRSFYPLLIIILIFPQGSCACSSPSKEKLHSSTQDVSVQKNATIQKFSPQTNQDSLVSPPSQGPIQSDFSTITTQNNPPSELFTSSVTDEQLHPLAFAPIPLYKKGKKDLKTIQDNSNLERHLPLENPTIQEETIYFEDKTNNYFPGKENFLQFKTTGGISTLKNFLQHVEKKYNPSPLPVVIQLPNLLGTPQLLPSTIEYSWNNDDRMLLIAIPDIFPHSNTEKFFKESLFDNDKYELRGFFGEKLQKISSKYPTYFLTTYRSHIPHFFIPDFQGGSNNRLFTSRNFRNSTWYLAMMLISTSSVQYSPLGFINNPADKDTVHSVIQLIRETGIVLTIFYQ